ncbi:MAG: ABC transporter permease [bacterium]
MLNLSRSTLIRLSWVSLVGLAGIMIYLGKSNIKWAFKVPRNWRLPLKKQISDLMDWLVNTADLGLFTFYEFTRGLAWVLEKPLDLATGVFATGILSGEGSAAVQLTQPLSWIAVIVLVMAIGHYANGWRLSLFVGACFGYLAVFGQWHSAMVTLSSVLIAVPIGVAGGMLLGIVVYRYRWMEKLVTPLLDLMQTVPVFAYLVPILFLFGFGPVAAMIATMIYAMPPMVRVTILAFRQVPEEFTDLGKVTGCTFIQMLQKVLIPAAAPSLMVGVNQVIMLSLNMVIIASMIGAGGLGYDVLTALRRLDIGAGFESGVAIVVLAIALDRLSQAFANRSEAGQHDSSFKTFAGRYPYTLFTGTMIVLVTVVALFTTWVQSYPDSMTITTGSFWSNLVKHINVNYFDQIEAFKVFILINVLLPFKRFLLMLPWPVVVLGVGLLGYQLGGWRLGLQTMLLALFCALVGLWDKAMVTVYLCGISVLFAALLGIPLGVAGAERPTLGRFLETAIDTLQTLPSFVYLMPVVMLFRVGDFAAMIAVVAYSIAPAIRYTLHGIRQVDPQLIEAGLANGCTRWQLLTKIKLRLAMPEIMLGINQTVMLALSMLVITALVGTRELGQEVYIALTKADTGRGIVAGLCVAFIAIITDRLIHAGVARSRQRLGLE